LQQRAVENRDASSGDDYLLEYFEDGDPKLPVCLTEDLSRFAAAA
jgi:hypothetical protein